MQSEQLLVQDWLSIIRQRSQSLLVRYDDPIGSAPEQICSRVSQVYAHGFFSTRGLCGPAWMYGLGLLRRNERCKGEGSGCMSGLAKEESMQACHVSASCLHYAITCRSPHRHRKEVFLDTSIR